MFRGAPALLALGVLLASCTTGPSTPQPRNGGTIVVSLPALPASLNPLVARDVVSQRAYTPLFPLLYAAQQDLSAGPALASALPQPSDAGRTLTIPLRQDAKWSDGVAITADDVVFTITMEMNPALQTQTPANWSPLTSVSAKDPHTVRITLAMPDAAFTVDRLVTPIVPAHALAKIDPAHMASAPYSAAPNVTGGPYLFSHRDGSNVFLDANAGFYLGRPHADHVDELVSADIARIPALLGEGSLSFVPDLTPDATAQAIISSGVSVQSFAEPDVVAVQFNVRAGLPFADGAVRQAFAACIDHDSVVAQAGGAANNIAVWGDINPASWAFDGKAATQYQRNPQHAQQLLHGAHPSATIIFPSDRSDLQAAATLLAQQAKDGGFSLTPQGIQPAQYQAALQSGGFDAALVNVAQGLDPDPSAWVASGGGANFGGYSNPTVDAAAGAELAAASASGVQVQQQRRPILTQIEQLVTHDLPLYFLWAPRHSMGFGATIAGVAGAGVQLDADRANSFYVDWFLTQ